MDASTKLILDEIIKRLTELDHRLKEQERKLGNRFAKVDRDRKSTRLNSSHITRSRMPSSA